MVYSIEIENNSSVDCGERVMRYFRFRSGSHFGSKKVFFGQFLGFKTSRTSRGRAQNKMAAPQSCLYEGTGSTSYTSGGATSSQKRGGLGCFLGFFGSQASRTSRGKAQKKRAALQSCLYDGIGSTCASEVSE